VYPLWLQIKLQFSSAHAAEVVNIFNALDALLQCLCVLIFTNYEPLHTSHYVNHAHCQAITHHTHPQAITHHIPELGRLHKPPRHYIPHVRVGEVAQAPKTSHTTYPLMIRPSHTTSQSWEDCTSPQDITHHIPPHDQAITHNIPELGRFHKPPRHYTPHQSWGGLSQTQCECTHMHTRTSALLSDCDWYTSWLLLRMNHLRLHDRNLLLPRLNR